MNKRWWVVLGLGLLVILVGIMFFYFALYNPESGETRTLKNPTDGRTVAQSVLEFDESFVEYLLYSVKANELHNPPLSSDKPKIQASIGDKVYNAYVQNGVVYFDSDETENPDLVLTTSTEEAVRMVMDRAYIQDSFGSDRSKVELRASKSLLFAKGYLRVYTELTGKSITGGVVKIYLD